MTLRTVALLPAATIAAAAAGVVGPSFAIKDVQSLTLEAKFVRAGGGTTLKVWVQTSLDGGVTWFDIACFAFTTASANKMHYIDADPATAPTPATVPASATLADDTVLNGFLGDRIRTIRTSTGTYTGATTIELDMVVRD